jgi:hypothetical protein
MAGTIAHKKCPTYIEGLQTDGKYEFYFAVVSLNMPENKETAYFGVYI